MVASGPLLRLAARGAGRRRDGRRSQPGATVAALRDALVARGGEHARWLARGRAVRCALDQVMGDESAALREGAEVAFFPPVTGG